MTTTTLHSELLKRFAAAPKFAEAFTRIVTGSGLYERLKAMPLDDAIQLAIDWCAENERLERLEDFAKMPLPPKPKPQPRPKPVLAWEGKHFRVVLIGSQSRVEYRDTDSLGGTRWVEATKKLSLQTAIGEIARAWLAEIEK